MPLDEPLKCKGWLMVHLLQTMGCVLLRWGCAKCSRLGNLQSLRKDRRRMHDWHSRRRQGFSNAWGQPLMEEMKEIMAILELLQLMWEMGKAIIMFELVNLSSTCLVRIQTPLLDPNHKSGWSVRGWLHYP